MCREMPQSKERKFSCLLKCLQVSSILFNMMMNVSTKLVSIIAKRDHSPIVDVQVMHNIIH